MSLTFEKNYSRITEKKYFPRLKQCIKKKKNIFALKETKIAKKNLLIFNGHAKVTERSRNDQTALQSYIRSSTYTPSFEYLSYSFESAGDLL